MQHNFVVFRNGENETQVWSQLLDIIPEPRLNLVNYHLRMDEPQEAFILITDLEAAVLREYILKPVVSAALGQRMGSREHLRMAKQCF